MADAPKRIRCLVANGAMLEAPIFEKHTRGTNWLAAIDVDASQPSGLSRRFMKRGRGECLYVVEQLSLFDAVEFGADYTTMYGDKKRDRWYGIVVAMGDGFIDFEQAATGARAVVRAKEARTSKRDQVAALAAEREALLARARKLEEEMQVLAEGDEKA